MFDGGGQQGAMTMQCRDPADGSRLMVQLIPCNHIDDVAFLTAEAADIRDTAHPGLVRLRGVYPHEASWNLLLWSSLSLNASTHLLQVERFGHTGMCYEKWTLVVFTTEFCAGGRLVDQADLMRDQVRAASETLLRHHQASLHDADAAVADALANEVRQLTSALAEQMELWASHVAGGLRALHEVGRTHRNLNPGNVYLDNKRRAVVGSYQCLKSSRGPGCPSSLGRADCGSAEVMAPEIEDGGVVTDKADIWAFGCCLYRWITGELPPMHSVPISRLLQRIPHAYGEKLRRTLRMALEPQVRARASADDVWEILSTSKRARA